MLAIVVLCALAALTSASTYEFTSRKYDDYEAPALSNDLLRTGTFRPKIDHFRPQDDREAEFTYTLNDQFYADNGPIFVFINDAGMYTTEWIQGGLVYDIARQLGGALATADHRYFGENIPTPTASFDDLAFLTVDQALADIATLIATVTADLEASNPRVIVWGVGYGGTLAVMARKKYPHLVHAVWASSGLFGATVFDNNYYDNLSSILRYMDSIECAERVNNAFDVLEYLIDNNESAYIQERLRLCTPLDGDDDQEVAVLIYRFVDLISQYILRFHLAGLNSFCRDIKAYDIDTLNSLIRWIEYVYGGSPECVNIDYQLTISALQNTDWANQTYPGSMQQRLLTYLRCTQVGGLKVTSDFVLGVFPEDRITEDYQVQFCQDVLGESYNHQALHRAVAELNFIYGGQDQIITHVVFSNAGLNPLIHFGIAEYDQIYSDVVFLTHHSAGADLRSMSTADSVDLYNAKQTISDMIRGWAGIDPR